MKKGEMIMKYIKRNKASISANSYLPKKEK